MNHITRYFSRLLPIVLLFTQLHASAQLRPFQEWGLWGFKDSTGAVIIKPAYEASHFFDEGLVSVRKNGKWGFINEAGKLVIDFKYGANGSFHGGVAAIKDTKGKWGVINRKGEQKVPFIYSYIFDFSEGVAGAELNNRHLLIDTSGNVLLDSLPYDYVNNSVNGLIQVRKDGHVGYINLKGQVKVPLTYTPSMVGPGFCEGLFGVGEHGKFGFIDTAGKIAIPFMYDNVWYFSDGLAAVRLNDRYGFINHEGQLVAPCQYDDAEPFYHGKAKIRIDRKRGYIDQTGKIIDSLETIPYDYVGDFWEGLRQVSLWGKWGYENEQHQEVIPLHFNAAGEFREGLAAVKVNSAYGYIDHSGRLVIMPMYFTAGNFMNGKAIVYIQGVKREITMPSPEALKEGYQVVHGTPVDQPSRVAQKTAAPTGDRTCSVCNGQGKVVKPIQNNLKQDSYGHWYKAVGTLYETCPMCHGKRTM